uniref:protein-serine/threonine phosphatase n=1 Tax=Angiostrongylus cantonensis TaxID=6313 RepID=A0A0K0CTH2_ANGCA
MGQTLSEPVTTKESASCVNELFTVGSSCMQGWRITDMEDAHTHLLSLPDDPRCAFFAVYDGHGGPKASQFAGINLHKQILQQPDYALGNLPEALRKGFLALDEQMRSDDQMRDDVSGATAVVVLVRDDVIHSNVGDSRAVVSVCGEAKPLSFDHKPANEMEAKRILAAGGWVEFNRVNGNLALSRALGDFVFKRNEAIPPEEQIVTAFPDVISENITEDHEFLVLACDGIWDVLSNQEVVDFVRERFAEQRDPQTICEELLTRCLAPDAQMGGVGCDNMTVSCYIVYLTSSAKSNRRFEVHLDGLPNFTHISASLCLHSLIGFQFLNAFYIKRFTFDDNPAGCAVAEFI